jgi:hypothetical protein
MSTAWCGFVNHGVKGLPPPPSPSTHPYFCCFGLLGTCSPSNPFNPNPNPNSDQKTMFVLMLHNDVGILLICQRHSKIITGWKVGHFCLSCLLLHILSKSSCLCLRSCLCFVFVAIVCSFFLSLSLPCPCLVCLWHSLVFFFSLPCIKAIVYIYICIYIYAVFLSVNMIPHQP